MPTRRAAIALLLFGAAAMRARGAASATGPVTYPHRVVTLVTHSTPGGGSDVFLRQMIRYLRRYIAASFVVENIAGGSGARAIARVAGARPDGSMLYAT